MIAWRMHIIYHNYAPTYVGMYVGHVTYKAYGLRADPAVL
jgi:hypothetical protein